jgi:hypothetical protein
MMTTWYQVVSRDKVGNLQLHAIVAPDDLGEILEQQVKRGFGVIAITNLVQRTS